MAIIISDALQIQLWINGTLTFNEETPPYPRLKKTFYQKFSIYDTVYVEIKDDVGLDYHLEFYDINSVRFLIVPLVEEIPGVYRYAFTGVALGIVDSALKVKVQQGITIGTVVTENQVSIEEFPTDMDGWTNEAHRPAAVLQSLDTFQQLDVSSPITTTDWTAQPSGPMIGKPYRSFPTFYTVPSYTRVAYIGFNGLNAYSYDIHTELKVEQNIAFTINFSAVFYFMDSSFNTLGSTGYVENNFAPGVKSFDFTIPAGIGNVAYIGMRIFDSSVHTSMTTLVTTWFVADVYNPAYADWAYSSDNGGCLKLTTVDTINKSVVSKSAITLPQASHFIIIKWDTTYPPVNSALSLVFKIKQGSTVLSSILLDVPTSVDEQVSVIPITSSLIWTVANALSIELISGGDPIEDSDVLHINSIEIYTETTTYITSFAERAKSDFVKFLTDTGDSFPMYYKSVGNFAGLSYTDVSPYKVLRIPGLFSKERKTTEQMSLSTSNGKEVSTASLIKFQKLMLISDVTDYMHTKIMEALQHCVSGSVVINNVEWIWQSSDNYEEVESDPTYMLTDAKIYLTRKNKTIRNVI